MLRSIARLVVRELKRGKKEVWDDIKPLRNPPGYVPPPRNPRLSFLTHIQVWKDASESYRDTWRRTLEGWKGGSGATVKKAEKIETSRPGEPKAELETAKSIEELVQEGKMTMEAAKKPGRRLFKESWILYKTTLAAFIAGYKEGFQNPLWNPSKTIKIAENVFKTDEEKKT
ncbi:uncharacterized protein [Oscarella lobularis]|uniref:uncharacterized protein n=1 Tax=Oscarella lobularis TaxID=121494 RepID=UPI003313B5F5